MGVETNELIKQPHRITASDIFASCRKHFVLASSCINYPKKRLLFSTQKSIRFPENRCWIVYPALGLLWSWAEARGGSWHPTHTLLGVKKVSIHLSIHSLERLHISGPNPWPQRLYGLETDPHPRSYMSARNEPMIASLPATSRFFTPSALPSWHLARCTRLAPFFTGSLAFLRQSAPQKTWWLWSAGEASSRSTGSTVKR